MYESYLSNPYVRALLDVIAYCEGADYNTIFGGGSFSGNQHPCRKVRAGGYNSDAAGRYQFLCSTWRGLGLPEFTPDYQDLGAVMLIARRGALADIARGDLQTAVSKLRQEWPSLPGGHQQTRNWSQVNSYFQNDLAAQGASSVSVQPPITTTSDDGYYTSDFFADPPVTAGGTDWFAPSDAGGFGIGGAVAIGACALLLMLILDSVNEPMTVEALMEKFWNM